MTGAFESRLSPAELKLIAGLDTPGKVQAFLDTVPYSEDKFYRCPLRVLRDRKAHCFDGALFAAHALRRIGFPPLILELIPNERDDDHILALFKQNGGWGAVAQSNFVGLRYREPVYRSLRELVMSYFEDFYNTAGEKTLRGYRGPINLKVFDRLEWAASDAGLETLADGMDRYRSIPILSKDMAAGLRLLDPRSLQAGLLGSNPDGLFKVS
ncbi:MAG TPA: hypothetical protein VMC09_13100 [Anaerolineales bacterium]|nr:hypothetical protein [Anaerolineales bacterium]